MILFASFLFVLIGVLEATQLTPFHGETALSTLVRSKRQIWYLCGQYPRQYYSNYPCYSITNTLCENGGRKIGVGCTVASQCVQYYAGPVTCLRSCCCTVPNPVPPIQNGGSGYCPNGQLSNIRCSGPTQCGQSFNCINGLCCSRTTNEYTVACGGQYAISQCTINRTCQPGLVCTASNYCCQCPVGTSGGRCNRGLCAAGFTCYSNGYCCSTCPDNSTPYGMCVNGQCAGGRRCYPGNICC